MKLLEHQSKELLAGFGLGFTRSNAASSADEIARLARELGGPVVVKAQVHAGGRGKAGAVRFAEGPDEAARAARDLMEMRLARARVTTVSIEPRVQIEREFYAGVAWDTSERLPMALFSDAGGVDVENSHRMARRHFDPWRGLEAHVGRDMAAEMGIDRRLLAPAGDFLSRLARAFLECDALLVEVNPLAVVDGGLLGLDAHVEIDDDAVFRLGARLQAFAGSGDRVLTALEREAQRIDSMDHRGVAGRLVEFDGNLGLLIGGGGASLTVFDAIRRHGGRPANYCEIGGNPTEEKVAALTALLVSKPGVTHLAVIMNVVNNTRADVVARGMIEGIRRSGRRPSDVVTVFRIPGSWEQEAAAMLAAEGIASLGRETSLEEAARLAVERSLAHAT